jgi:hypothetical protein
MKTDKLKTPKKGAVKRIREFYEKNRGKPSIELGEILKTPADEKSQDKKSAKAPAKDLEI